MSSFSRPSSRRGFHLTSATTQLNGDFVPVPPPTLINQRGYYSDIVTRESSHNIIVTVIQPAITCSKLTIETLDKC